MSSAFKRRRQILTLIASSAATAGLAACGGGGGTPTPVSPTVPPPVATPVPVVPPQTPPATPPVTVPSNPVIPAVKKSAKRGIAYDLADPADLAALAPGLSWWYNWGTRPHANVPGDYTSRYAMDYIPMLWDENTDTAAMTAFLKTRPDIKYLLLMNEPNLVDQANLKPAEAAAQWPRYEAIAAQTGVKLVGPAITWGTMANFGDPVVWMDAFLAAYRAANGGREPQIDYLAFHWYDYGLKEQLDTMSKYGKPFWVTEMANWHSQNDGAQINTVAKQKEQMTAMVALCEGRADVFRYAWFIGRMAPQADPHFTSLLSASGVLTELGAHYLSLPFPAA
jgi:hypothetical protein